MEEIALEELMADLERLGEMSWLLETCSDIDGTDDGQIAAHAEVHARAAEAAIAFRIRFREWYEHTTEAERAEQLRRLEAAARERAGEGHELDAGTDAENW